MKTTQTPAVALSPILAAEKRAEADWKVMSLGRTDEQRLLDHLGIYYFEIDTYLVDSSVRKYENPIHRLLVHFRIGCSEAGYPHSEARFDSIREFIKADSASSHLTRLRKCDRRGTPQLTDPPSKLTGDTSKLTGDTSKLSGNCTGLYGICIGLRGDCTDLAGNCTDLVGDCTGLYGVCSAGLIGDCSDLVGDSVALYGDCSDLVGDCSDLFGDCTGLFGCCTDLSGNLDDCEFESGTDIETLVT